MYILKHLKTVFSGDLLISKSLSFCIRAFTKNHPIVKHRALTESNSKYLIYYDVKLFKSAKEQELYTLKEMQLCNFPSDYTFKEQHVYLNAWSHLHMRKLQHIHSNNLLGFHIQKHSHRNHTYLLYFPLLLLYFPKPSKINASIP